MAVANHFVLKGIAADTVIDQLKVQKLTYYAFAWWAAFTGSRLFPEPVEAWRHGPAIASLRSAFGSYGPCRIRRAAPGIAYVHGRAIRISPAVLDPPVTRFLDDVWTKFGNFDAIQLSNMTHSEDEP